MAQWKYDLKFLINRNCPRNDRYPKKPAIYTFLTGAFIGQQLLLFGDGLGA